MKSRRRTHGFTVVELLIAIGIILLVIGIIFLLVHNSRVKAVDAKTKESLLDIRTSAVNEHLLPSGGVADTGYTNVCSSDGVRERLYSLAADLQTADYACISSSERFVITFPLKADDGYWCVDAEGASTKVPSLATTNPPYTCDHLLPGGGASGGGGSGAGAGSGGGSGGGGSGGGSGGSSNATPDVVFGSGSLSINGATQMCAGYYCVIIPETADPDLLAFVSGTDAEDGTVAVAISDESFVSTSAIPTDGPGASQKTIAGLGIFDSCAVTSKKVTYTVTDSGGLTSSKDRTVLWCHDIDSSQSGGNADQPTGDTTPPTVTLGSVSSTVSGTVTLTATASDDVGIGGVTFKYDNTAIGSEDTTNPYSVSWDTRLVNNGTYAITATARDTSGNITTSTIAVVTVSNTPPGGSGSRKALLFSSGFEGTSSTYLNGFDPSTYQYCCSYSLTQSTTVKHEGLASLRTEVRSTDPMVSGGWRAEVEPMSVDDLGDRWYGWSVYFETPQSNGLFNGNYGGHYVQWNSNTGGQAQLSWLWNSNKWDLTTNPDLSNPDHLGNGGPVSITANTWHDVVIHANWSTGQLEAWLDGTLFYSAAAGSGLISENPGQYLKFGTERWGNGGGQPTGTKWVIYYDNLRIGDGAVPGLGYYDVAPGNY